MNTRSVLRVGGALLLLLLVGGALLPVLGGGGPPVDGSVGSSEPEGRRAIHLLAQELGFDAGPWIRPPGLLPEETQLWMARAPSETLEGDDGSDPLRRAVGEGAQSPLHYRSFVQRGGAVVLPAGESEIAFVSEVLDAPAAEELSLIEPESAPSLARLPDGEELAVSWGGRVFGPIEETGEETDEARSLESLIEDENGNPLAVRVPSAAGSVVLLAWDGFLGNEDIGEEDHGILFVRLVEATLPAEYGVRFDEYAIGRWRRRGLLELAFSGRLLPVTVAALFLATLFTWRRARTRSFPRDPKALQHVSPLSRAESLAELLQRAGRFDLLGSMSRHGAWRRIVGRSRGVRRASVDEDPGATEDQESEWREHVLERLGEVAGVSEAERAEMAATLCGQAVTSAGELEELERRLDLLQN